MARRTIGQKAHRVLDFLVGLGHPSARSALAGYGFGEEDLDDGWERLKALSKTARPIEPESSTPALLAEIDGWENRWLPIADVVLRTHFPSVHGAVFGNLTQTEGTKVVISVSVLLDRLERIVRPAAEGGLGKEGRAARALLAKRGLTEEVARHAARLLSELTQFEAPEAGADDDLAREDRAAAEQHLWSWYTEWSSIARIAIRDRRVLRSLGFAANARRGGGGDDEEAPG